VLLFRGAGAANPPNENGRRLCRRPFLSFAPSRSGGGFGLALIGLGAMGRAIGPAGHGFLAAEMEAGLLRIAHGPGAGLGAAADGLAGAMAGGRCWRGFRR